MPTKQIPASDSIAPLEFPQGGINVSCETERQTPGTTPSGVNVRTFEPSEQRGRGGARPGIIKYINSAVSAGHLIQHLNFIVDPQAAAFPSYDPPVVMGHPTIGGGPGTIPFADPTTAPRNPYGFYVPTGGTGFSPTLNPVPQRGSWFFIQYLTNFTGNPSTAGPTTEPVTAGDLLLVGVSTFGNNAGITAVVTDSLGNTYTQAGGYAYTPGGGVGNYQGASLWYCVSAFSGVATITVTTSPANLGGGSIFMEIAGSSATPLDGTDSNTDPAPATSTFTAGTPSLSSTKELLIAYFAGSNNTGLITPPSGLAGSGQGATLMEFPQTPGGGGPNPAIQIDSISTATLTTANGSTGFNVFYAAVSATFLHR